MYLKANTKGNRNIKSEIKRAEVGCQIKCRMIQNRQGYTGKTIQMQEYAQKKTRMAILEICMVKKDGFHGK